MCDKRSLRTKPSSKLRQIESDSDRVKLVARQSFVRHLTHTCEVNISPTNASFGDKTINYFSKVGDPLEKNSPPSPHSHFNPKNNIKIIFFLILKYI